MKTVYAKWSISKKYPKIPCALSSEKEEFVILQVNNFSR